MLKQVNPTDGEGGLFWENKVNTMATNALWPLLLTWINFNPIMDK